MSILPNSQHSDLECPHFAKLLRAQDENAALRKRVEDWEEDARRYAGNADYWRGMAEKAEADLAAALDWIADGGDYTQMARIMALLEKRREKRG